MASQAFINKLDTIIGKLEALQAEPGADAVADELRTAKSELIRAYDAAQRGR